MGSGQSIPQGMPSRDRYKKATADTSDIMNYVFNWMLKEVEIRDLLNLANPKYCKEYIFLTKEALDKYFTHIQLEPKLGKGSVLYFQKTKTLTFADEKNEALHKEDKVFRDTMCSQLAFFYVRLFQVFGALALTVVDTLPDVSSSTENIRRGILTRPTPRPPLFGGGFTAVTYSQNDPNLGVFYEIARQYLRRSNDEDIEYIFIDDPTKTKSSTVYTQDSVGVLLFYPTSAGESNLIYNINTTLRVSAFISITNYTSAGDKYTLDINNIQINYGTPIGRQFSISMRRSGLGRDYYYEGKTLNIVKVLKAILTAMAKPDDQGRSTSDILAGKQALGREVTLDDTTVPEGLRTRPIIEYMTKRPKAYCVARAIQLLSPTLLDSIRAGVPMRSEICYSGQVPGLPDSLPYYSGKITDHTPSLRALHQLFFDELLSLTPKISDATMPRYREFVKIMQNIYSEDAPTQDVTEINQVINQPLRKCQGSYKDQQLYITNTNALRNIRRYVGELLNYQMKHSANVLEFMKKKMLNYSGGHFSGINPKLLEGGIPAVNKLAEEAREMLINYYQVCESTYRKGAHVVLDSQGLVVQPPRK